MSKFIYSMSALSTPKEIIKEITTCFYSLLWNKVDRIKRNTLISKYEQGGIKMIDVESIAASLKAAWIPRLINLKDNKGKSTPRRRKGCLRLGNVKLSKKKHSLRV